MAVRTFGNGFVTLIISQVVCKNLEKYEKLFLFYLGLTRYFLNGTFIKIAIKK